MERSRSLLLGFVVGVAACGGGGTPRDEAPPPPTSATAFVVATSFDSGSFAVFPLDDPESIAVNLADLHSDAVARAAGGRIYVLNRLGGDNVQALDPDDGFRTIWQCSVGNGANPHDIAVAAPNKAYVTLYEETTLLVVDPSVGEDCAGFVRGEVDLARFADDDGIPEMDQTALVGRRLYVSLQRLSRRNFFQPTDASLLAVIDVATDELVDVDPGTPEIDAIRLSATNPFSDFQSLMIDPASGKILVGEVGSFGEIGDGGIELVDPVANRAEGFFVGETDLGGNLTDFLLVDETRGYAIVSDLEFNNRLIHFDPSRRRVVRTLLVTQEFVTDIEHDPERDELYVSDRGITSPGIRIFRGPEDVPVTDRPIDTGLPPFDLVLLR